jgi:pilus assembly protein Flp/PilA
MVEFMKREDGPTAVEYAVMLSLIIIVCVAAIAVLGHKASGSFTTVGQTLGAS